MKEQKAALRREIRARIAALPEEYLRESDAGILEYLHGREFQVDEVPFQKKYFS